MENNDAFLGQGWAFPPEFFANGSEVELVSGNEDIRHSLLTILSTGKGERTMLPNFGCDLSQFLFEEMDQSMMNEMKAMIENAILNDEPRIKVDDINFEFPPSDLGLVLISIDYSIRTTNNRYNLVYPFYLKEANIS